MPRFPSNLQNYVRGLAMNSVGSCVLLTETFGYLGVAAAFFVLVSLIS